jgi:MoxR-like ATPase
MSFAYTGTESQNQFLRALANRGINSDCIYTRAQLVAAAEDLDLAYPPAWIVKDASRSRGRGLYSVLEVAGFASGSAPAPAVAMAAVAPAVAAAVRVKRKYTRRAAVATPSIPTAQPFQPLDVSQKFEAADPVKSGPTISVCEMPVDEALRPKRPEWYVPNKIHDLLLKIFASGRFAPVFIYGHKGTGKTTAAIAAAADCNREMFRVNITSETSEDDLLGGFRLVGGETVWADGPVTLAMKRGAILVLDEMDRGDRKILCLQPVLEGNPVLLKKIGRVVVPQPGFTVVATGNTRGRGSEDNRYNGAFVQDEALLDRFHIGFHQDFPEKSVEINILRNVQSHCGYNDPGFVKDCANWANQIRKTFKETGEGEMVSTRNLVDAMRLLPILGSDTDVIDSICGKFDEITARAFRTLFDAVKANPRSGLETEGIREATGATADSV